MAAVRIARQPFLGRPGFLLLEALIGFALFALFLTAVGLTVLVSQQGTSSASNRSRAIALSQGALDGVRSMRNESWDSISAGVHGVTVQNGAWVFSGTSVQTSDGFTTSVVLTAAETGRMTARATTTWDVPHSASGSVVLDTELTDWHTPKAVGNWASPQTVGSWSTTDNPLFNRVAVANDVAAVTSETSAGGAGLYLFDVSSPSSPQRIATSFMLGYAGHDLVIAGNTLFVITEDPVGELRVYDIEDAPSFSSASLVGSYDIPGSGRARSMMLRGSTLVVGAQTDGSEDEVYLFDVSAPYDPTLEGAFNVDADVPALDSIGATLFFATSDDTAELRIADITDPAAPSAPTGSGYNLTDTTDASVVAATGTSAVVGRLAGAFVEELVLFAVGSDSDDLVTPGPWYWEVGDAVNGLSVDPSQHYAFAAATYAGREFSVVDLARWQRGLSAIVASIASTTGEGRGVFYDPADDRVYHVTRRTFSIFRPS